MNNKGEKGVLSSKVVIGNGKVVIGYCSNIEEKVVVYLPTVLNKEREVLGRGAGLLLLSDVIGNLYKVLSIYGIEILGIHKALVGI